MSSVIRIQNFFRVVLARTRVRKAKDVHDMEATKKALILHMSHRRAEQLKADHDAAHAQHESGQCPWVEGFDTEHHAFYYYNYDTGDTVWEKPDEYIMAADDLMFRSVIQIQSRYRSRVARRRAEAIKAGKARPVGANLLVEVDRATNLQDRDLIGKSDPLVVVVVRDVDEATMGRKFVEVRYFRLAHSKRLIDYTSY